MNLNLMYLGLHLIYDLKLKEYHQYYESDITFGKVRQTQERLIVRQCVE